MKLPHTKEVKIIVDYHDLENLVTEIYGHEYEYVADVECGNDEGHSYTVKKEEFNTPIGKYERKDMDKFVTSGKYNYLASTILNDLADQDIIEEGNYLINVSW